MIGEINCPKCNRMDMALKVSAIITGQTHNIHGTSYENSTYVDKEGKTHSNYYSIPYNGTQTSVLAQRLSPPEQPKIQSNIDLYGLLSGLGFASYILLICLFSPGALITSLVFFLSYINQLNSVNANGIINGMGTRIIVFLVGMGGSMLVTIAVILGIGYFLFSQWKSNSKRNAEKRTRQIAEVEKETPRWEHAMRRWNELYYCQRDDLIFIPGENTSATIEKMMEYIYQ